MAKTLEPDLCRDILETLQTGVYVVDLDGKIMFWNEGAERITGLLRQDMIGRTCRDNFLAQADGENNELTGPLSPINIAIRDGKRVQVQASLRHKLGHRILVQLCTFPVRNERGSILAVAESFEESVSAYAWSKRQNKLEEYGCIDQASGVMTQGLLQTHLRKCVDNFAEYPIPFSILCIEIDGREKIQMRDGHGAITAIFRTVGETLEGSLRPTDFIGRWDEDQFLVVLTECSDTEISRVANRLLKMVNLAEMEWWGDRLALSVSVGGAVVRPRDTLESIVSRVKAALRESLEQGGNRVVINND